MKLILFEKCSTREEFVNKIYEEQADVLLIDYKMASTYGFNGTSLISYINDRVQDLECFILTAVEQERITDGLVAKRNRFSKTIFDTEGDDPDKVKAFNEFGRGIARERRGFQAAKNAESGAVSGAAGEEKVPIASWYRGG